MALGDAVINFRFHLVSLTAVFLALGIGIAVGATVVDQATVEFLERQLSGVERRLDTTDAQNAALRAELERWRTFADQARDEAVAGRLEGVPVLVLGVQGIDRRPVEQLVDLLGASRAGVQGTAWFTSKMRLATPEDVAALADLVGVASLQPEVVRRAAVTQLAADLASDRPTGLLAALRDAAFVEFEPPAGGSAELGAVPAGTRFVIVSDGGAEVANEELAGPLAVQLAQQAPGRVLAAEAGREPQGRDRPGVRAVFVGPLRAHAEVSALLSTVDNLEDFPGRFAAVYALRDLTTGTVGHFGVGPRATRLVPEQTA